MKTPQESGREWEEIWKEKIGGKLQPGSGNKFYAKLDVRSKGITWSNKWTSKGYFRIDRSIITEAEDATIAPGGNASIPAIALRIESLGDFVIIGADDFIELTTMPTLTAGDKAAAKRRKANTPELLLDAD